MTPLMSSSRTDGRCRSRRSIAICEEPEPSLACCSLAATDLLLCSPDEGEHDADDQHDNSHPDKKVSPAHRGRGDAAKPEQGRDQRDDDQNQRVINKISGHMDSLSE